MWYRKAKEQMQAEVQQHIRDGQAKRENVRFNTPAQSARDGMSHPANVRYGTDGTEGSSQQE